MSSPTLVVFSTDDHDSYAIIDKIPEGGDIYVDWEKSIEEAKLEDPDQWTHENALEGMSKRGWEFRVLGCGEFELLCY